MSIADLTVASEITRRCFSRLKYRLAATPLLFSTLVGDILSDAIPLKNGCKPFEAVTAQSKCLNAF